MAEIPIPYTNFGGQGKIIHFLHANGYPPECYTPLFEYIRTGFNIVGMHQRPLWPGEKPGRLIDWQPLAIDYLRFISEQNTTEVIAVGHSVGAINILRAALLEPHKFRAIILVEPVLFPPTFILFWKLIRISGLGRTLHPMIPTAMKRRRKFDNLDLVFRGYRSRGIFRNFSDESLRAYVRGITRPSTDHGYELVYSPEWEAHIYLTGVWRDLEIWRGLKKLQVPALFIKGADTDTFRDESARRVKKITPGVRLETIPNAGHLVPLERPKEVADLIFSFTKELS